VIYEDLDDVVVVVIGTLLEVSLHDRTASGKCNGIIECALRLARLRRRSRFGASLTIQGSRRQRWREKTWRRNDDRECEGRGARGGWMGDPVLVRVVAYEMKVGCRSGELMSNS
jgi:hypothetical protein